MISEERKQELIKSYKEESDGHWIQELIPEEKKLVLQWQYAYYQGEVEILKTILGNIQEELDEIESMEA